MKRIAAISMCSLLPVFFVFGCGTASLSLPGASGPTPTPIPQASTISPGTYTGQVTVNNRRTYIATNEITDVTDTTNAAKSFGPSGLPQIQDNEISLGDVHQGTAGSYPMEGTVKSITMTADALTVIYEVKLIYPDFTLTGFQTEVFKRIDDKTLAYTSSVGVADSSVQIHQEASGTLTR